MANRQWHSEFNFTPSLTPNQISIYLNSTDGTNTTTQDLNCYFTPTDNDSVSLNASIWWYKNNILQSGLNVINTPVTNGTLHVETLNSGYTSHFDNWTCEVQICDSQTCNNKTNSSILKRLNSAPTISTQNTFVNYTF